MTLILIEAIMYLFTKCYVKMYAVYGEVTTANPDKFMVRTIYYSMKKYYSFDLMALNPYTITTVLVLVSNPKARKSDPVNPLHFLLHRTRQRNSSIHRLPENILFLQFCDKLHTPNLFVPEQQPLEQKQKITRTDNFLTHVFIMETGCQRCLN